MLKCQALILLQYTIQHVIGENTEVALSFAEENIS
jgi:hypothetical protein